MDVAAGHQKVSLFFNNGSVEASLKDMPNSLVTEIEIFGIFQLDVMKNFGYGALEVFSSKKEMDVIWHEGIAEQGKRPSRLIFFENLKIPLIIGIVVKNRLSVIPASSHVVDGAR